MLAVGDAAAKADGAPETEAAPGVALWVAPPLTPPDSPSQPPTTSDAPSAVATTIPDRDRSEATGRRRAAVRRVTGRAMLMRRYRGGPSRPFTLEVTMIESLRFLGVRTAAFHETVALYRDAFGLEPVLERPGAAWFRARDGSSIHVYAADDADHDFFGEGPVVGLAVGDFDATRAARVAAGIGFIGEPQRDAGVAWNHYRGPDGNVYEIIGPDRSRA